MKVFVVEVFVNVVVFGGGSFFLMLLVKLYVDIFKLLGGNFKGRFFF